jgi:predicted porin
MFQKHNTSLLCIFFQKSCCVTLRGSLLLSVEDATAFGFCGFLANQQQAENRMNKKLITLAVAAAMTAPAAALAEATLYGKLDVSIDYFDIDKGFKGWSLSRGNIRLPAPNLAGDFPGVRRGSRVGVKGSEDLGGGLKAIYQIEFGVPIANEADNDINNGDPGGVYMRNTFVGLAGNFGTILVGRHDSPLKISTERLDLFNYTMADYAGTVGFDDNRFDNTITYISPSFRGFQLAGAMVPGGASTVGGDENTNADSIAEGWSVAGIYSNGPFYGSAAYEFISKQQLAEDITDPNNPYYTINLLSINESAQTIQADIEGPGTVLDVPEDDFTKWRFGLGLLDWNGFTLDGIYEYWDIANTNVDLWQIQTGYAFGNNMIKGMYGQNDVDDSDFKTDTWAIGVDHNFSKRSQVYLLYTDVDVDNTDAGDWNGFSIGIRHQF